MSIARKIEISIGIIIIIIAMILYGINVINHELSN